MDWSAPSVAALVAIGLWLVLPQRSSDHVITEVRPSATLKGSELDLRALLAKVRPSVVSIKTGTRSVSGDSEAAGSGVVLSGDGLVLTNAHVIEGATAIQVTLSDGSTHPADLVGSFTANDVAIVKAARRVGPHAGRARSRPTGCRSATTWSRSATRSTSARSRR